MATYQYYCDKDVFIHSLDKDKDAHHKSAYVLISFFSNDDCEQFCTPGYMFSTAKKKISCLVHNIWAN